MKTPRFRIAWLMALVALAALNFGAVRGFVDSYTEFYALVAGCLPMGDVLAVGLMIGGLRFRNHRFLLGFEVFGSWRWSSASRRSFSPRPWSKRTLSWP